MNSSSLSRRDWIRNMSCLTLGATLLTSRNVHSGGSHSDALLPLEKIGLQLYTVRDLLSADFDSALRLIADIGYRELEFAGYHYQEIQHVGALLQELQLSAPSAHVGLDTVKQRLDEAIKTASLLGHRHLVLPWLMEDQRQTMRQYEALARTLNQAGATCRSAGIELGYHNHDFEFQPLEGKLPYDVLLEQTAPDLVKMELDLYWITKAGYSATDYFDKHPGRFTQCHVKDMGSNGDIVDVGQGTINFAALIPAAKAAGVKHFYAENDNPHNPETAIRASYRALAGT